ncbi:MAG: glucosamine-6-phosphate deaminase [Promicromonosporaceae bacterium]|nr:glucosamine-6-phosphate deaminase [Promicromonosporaceae bacterium]
MELIIAPAAQLAILAADRFEAVLRAKPRAVLGLATGSSPLPTYDELARRHREGGLSFAQATGFTLDEYVGIDLDHPERYRNVIAREITDRVQWPAGQVSGPDGSAADLTAAAAAYETAIRDAGGVDLQILGIGSNGHIAFNEPLSALTSRTRSVPLTEQTRRDNARFFGGNLDLVPTLCLTQGLGTIMEAREIVLVATGAGKAEAIAQLVEGPISASWPATVLQMHPNTTVLVDKAAAAGLTRHRP